MSPVAARLQFVLNELRLPTVKRLWAALAEQSNKEGWMGPMGGRSTLNDIHVKI